MKSIDELMKEYKEAAKYITEPYKNSYILGRLESAYKILHTEYVELKKKRK